MPATCCQTDSVNKMRAACCQMDSVNEMPAAREASYLKSVRMKQCKSDSCVLKILRD